jgi:dienelactone hydrolase
MSHKSSIFIPSPETGVRLELVVARPRSKGPYPTLVFNHGSTGRGCPSMFSRTICPPSVQNYFTDRGWQVLFPQRRGRGKSGGNYAEGLAADGTGNSCDASVSMRGFERAVEDLDAVMAHVRTRDDVDLGQIVIGGMSRGGILSIAYAGLRRGEFCGAINFNGGWLGVGCPTYETVNPLIFKMGAAAGISTLWLHGSKDQYYRMSHCRSNFDGYVSDGGKGVFVAVLGGHGLVHKPQLWKHALDRYMEQIERAPAPEHFSA